MITGLEGTQIVSVKTMTAQECEAQYGTADKTIRGFIPVKIMLNNGMSIIAKGEDFQESGAFIVLHADKTIML